MPMMSVRRTTASTSASTEFGVISDNLVADARAAIGAPELPAAAMVYNPDGINMFTPVSPHGRLLQALGFEVADPGRNAVAFEFKFE